MRKKDAVGGAEWREFLNPESIPSKLINPQMPQSLPLLLLQFFLTRHPSLPFCHVSIPCAPPSGGRVGVRSAPTRIHTVAARKTRCEGARAYSHSAIFVKSVRCGFGSLAGATNRRKDRVLGTQRRWPGASRRRRWAIRTRRRVRQNHSEHVVIENKSPFTANSPLTFLAARKDVQR